ncbi:PilZ domain-containing protein [Desulfonema ishimotonii]|uniref:PilZ domain-containing protein n=1 Tax=Desulfonema ishimotonii TaxID=45657 RepID=A0A401FUG2_9BACT|nr:PilZ domain-containing protein [Desulfonema ishimotonii]GBC60595.1 PilZ domain-containing protein [Desulfonema ishimotonii]
MDKRTARRRNIIYYLKVFDSNTNLLLGQLVDITVNGMKLISEEPAEPGIRLMLKMILPEEMHRKECILFEAESLWCKRDINPSYYSIGFEFLDISEDDINIVKSLIYDFSFQD